MENQSKDKSYDSHKVIFKKMWTNDFYFFTILLGIS